MISFLSANPILLLFLICGIGSGLGSLKIGRRGPRLGTATVLFVGLFFGALSPRIQLPPIVGDIGLVFLMYTTGIMSSKGLGPGVAKQRTKEVVTALVTIFAAVAIVALVSPLIPITGGYRAAVFSGILSNSTGLAAIEDALHISGASAHALQIPIVAFSLAYPTSIFIPMLVLPLVQKFSGIEFKKEADSDPEYRRSHMPIRNAVIEVNLPRAIGKRLEEATDPNHRLALVYGRLFRKGQIEFAAGKQVLQQGDRVEVVGTDEEINILAEHIGRRLPESDTPANRFELRRVFVSKPEVAGKALNQLKITQNFGFKITRVRRGDTEFVPDENTRLEIGDRLRVLSLIDSSEQIRDLLGDSIDALGGVNYLSIGLGIIGGVLLGLIPFPLPGGLHLNLGLAGGPLIVGLLLARLDRTGPIIWRIPDPVARVLGQLGMIFYAAALGVEAGGLMWQSVQNPLGLRIIALASGIGLVIGLFSLWFSCRVQKMGVNRGLGIYVGVLTQPIVLDYVQGVTGNDLPSNPYVLLFPICLIVKILLSQILLFVLK